MEPAGRYSRREGWYNWNIVENDIKHHKLKPIKKNMFVSVNIFEKMYIGYVHVGG
jgi:hypothetical protein